MSHEQMVMAMKPFAQVEGYLSRSQEGVGLGLPLAQGITKLHGGTLNLDSQPGAGTTAMVTLPGRAVQSSAIGKVA
jgi:signal transduction histidine kinase